MSREAMKLALEALEGMYIQGFTQDDSPINNAITALREALAEPDFWEGYVPEPDKRQQALDRMAENARELGLDYEPVQQEPEHIVRSNGRYSPLLTHMMNERVKSNVKQVIHLYDEPPKQPAPATELPEQEPVARQYQNRDGVWKDFISEKHYKDTLEDGSWPIRNLYTSPPAQQEPVACKTLCELCAKRGYSGCANAAQITPIPSPPARQEPVKSGEGASATVTITLPAQRDIRNATLDEIADKIAKMPFGDTAASFAVWIREQKT